MKYLYKKDEMPHTLDKLNTYGFHWLELVASIPSPLVLVTSYKESGVANAAMQSWCTFTSDNKGFYVIMSAVSLLGHMYKTLHKKGAAVLNFMSADIYDKCMSTIRNNGEQADELAASGLTAKRATVVDAPIVEECFMNLECRYLWEQLKPEGVDAVVCLEVLAVHIDGDRLDENKSGRTGDRGILYNVHYPVNPESFRGTSHDWVAVLKKIRDYNEY